jgi:hypothetical protein
VAFIHFAVGTRSKLLDKAPASIHCAYLLRESYGPAEAHIAYIMRHSEKTRTREDLVYSSIHNLPAFAKGSPSAFFHAGEIYGAVNARLGRTRTIALPRELNLAQQRDLCHDFLESQFGDRHPYVFAIHSAKASDGLQNDHMHLIYSAKTLDGMERSAAQFWKRYNPQHPEHGGARVDPWFTEQRALYAQRQAWSDCCNRALELAGQEARVSPFSLVQRGVARQADIHLDAWHPTQSKYGRGVSEAWQERLNGMPAREAARLREHAQAADAWEARKRELGLTEDIAREAFLARVYEATRAYQPAPRLTAQELAQEEGMLHQQKRVAHRLQAEVIRHRHYAANAMDATDAMRSNAKRLIAEREALDREDTWERLEKPLIGNRQSLIYHAPGDPNYGDVRPQHQMLFWSHGEAEQAGYRQAQNQHHGQGASTPMADSPDRQRRQQVWRGRHERSASPGLRPPADILPHAEGLGSALDHEEEGAWIGVHYAYDDERGYGY